MGPETENKNQMQQEVDKDYYRAAPIDRELSAIAHVWSILVELPIRQAGRVIANVASRHVERVHDEGGK